MSVKSSKSLDFEYTHIWLDAKNCFMQRKIYISYWSKNRV